MNKNDERKLPQRQNIQDDGKVNRRSGADTESRKLKTNLAAP